MRMLQKALTFDDVLLVPAHSAILPRDVSLATRLTRKIQLNLPLLSAAMDTVTEARLAIALAQEGGIGIVHKNLNPKAQAAEVAKVKRFESGVLKDPITVPPTMTVREVLALTRSYRISGLPVVDNGVVVGIVTNRDTRFETNLDQAVRAIMTPRDRLVTVMEGSSPEEAKALMHKHRLERVLVVNADFQLRGLVTVKDILKSSEHPFACKDEQGHLRCGAAVGVGEGTEERVELLAEAGVDVIVVDTAHGHSEGVLKRVQWVKKNFPQVEVIGGNIATATAAKALVDHGADGVKVGIGPGSICTTRIVAGVGVPQITAVDMVANALAARHAADCRWRHTLFGRHLQGHRRRCQCRDAGRSVRRYRRSAGRDRAVPGPFLQVLSRHGFARRHAGRAADRYFQDSTTPMPTSWCRKASKAACRYKGSGARRDSSVDGRPAFLDGLSRLRHDSAEMPRKARSSSKSPRPASANRTCMTCRSPRKHRTTTFD
jgi:inosine-5'-monophosphate dehydrogenase